MLERCTSIIYVQYSNVCGVLAHLGFGVHSTLLLFGVLAHHRCADNLVCHAHPIFYSVDVDSAVA